MFVSTAIGVLVQHPRLHHTRNHEPVLNLVIRVRQRTRCAETNTWTHEPYLIDVAHFGERAPGLANILKRGMLVGAQGNTKFRTVLKNGAPIVKTEIISQDVYPVDMYTRRVDIDDDPALDETH